MILEFDLFSVVEPLVLEQILGFWVFPYLLREWLQAIFAPT